jgi:hypothetical protein
MTRKISFGRMTNAQVEVRARSNQSTADFGYLGHERGNEAYDRVQRQAYPSQLSPRAAYSYLIGEPIQLAPADYAGARDVLRKIEAAMYKGGWTRNEWRRLRAMWEKWKRRADGKDERFNLVGNKQGGVCKSDSTHLSTIQELRKIRKLIPEGGEVD